MSLTVYSDIDEEDVARAIHGGNLRLEHILQNCLTSERVVESLIKDMEALGGTREAGRLTAMFAQAMIES